MPSDFRSHFLLDPDVTYLNHGSFGACPKPVFDDYQKWQLALERDSFQFFLDVGRKELEKSKQALADYINCAVEDLIYVPNPTHGMNIVIGRMSCSESCLSSRLRVCTSSADMERGPTPTWNEPCWTG